MSDFEVGDLVLYRKVAGTVQYCEEGTVLQVVRVGSDAKDPYGFVTYRCTIVLGAWVDAYSNWPLNKDAMFFQAELERLHDTD